MIMRQRAVEVKGDLSCPRKWARTTDLQDGAEKRFQSLPNSTARIEALQPRFALFPEEEPGCIVPPGTADNSPPFQRWDKPRSIILPSPGGTAEALRRRVSAVPPGHERHVLPANRRVARPENARPRVLRNPCFGKRAGERLVVSPVSRVKCCLARALLERLNACHPGGKVVSFLP